MIFTVTKWYTTSFYHIIYAGKYQEYRTYLQQGSDFTINQVNTAAIKATNTSPPQQFSLMMKTIE